MSNRKLTRNQIIEKLTMLNIKRLKRTTMKGRARYDRRIAGLQKRLHVFLAEEAAIAAKEEEEVEAIKKDIEEVQLETPMTDKVVIDNEL